MVLRFLAYAFGVAAGRSVFMLAYLLLVTLDVRVLLRWEVHSMSLLPPLLAAPLTLLDAPARVRLLLAVVPVTLIGVAFWLLPSLTVISAWTWLDTQTLLAIVTCWSLAGWVGFRVQAEVKERANLREPRATEVATNQTLLL